ncbi:MAG: GNAT family N-acetyltransferase [Zoogloea sp.]|nr:MAG: GNAT family N-acetyltransferase [Zoogloea sp.]
MTIREFEEADRAALRLLYLASRNAAFTWSAIESFQAGDFDIHTDGERILVAEGNGAILGFASIWEPDSFLHNLFVHPSFTRKGVGRALLAGCAKHFSGPPTLKCMKANTQALQFYASQGWSTLREETGPDGPYFLMTKR